MGTLLDAARARVAKRGPTCTVGMLLESNPARRVEIDELIANAGADRPVPYTIAAVLLSEEFQVKIRGATLSRHAQGACACHS